MKKYISILFALKIGVASCFGLQPSDPEWNRAVLSFEDAKTAADAGDAYAQAVISVYYGIGWKTDKNPQLSLRYAANSAKGGSPLGLYRLGSMLRNGEGIAKNESEGLELQKRAVQGLQDMGDNPYALSSLGVILFQGKIETEDKGAAATLYKKASSMGYAPAALNLARWPEKAPGEPSVEERIELLKQAARAGLQTATKLLAEKGTSLDEERSSIIKEPSLGAVCVVNNNFHQGYVNSATFLNSDEILATASGDGSVKIWSIPSNQLIRTINAPAPVGVVTYNKDKDELFVSGGQNKKFSYAAIYDPKTGNLKYPYFKIKNWGSEEWPIAYDSSRRTLYIVRREGIFERPVREWITPGINTSSPIEIDIEKNDLRKVADLPIKPIPLFPCSLTVSDGNLKLLYSKDSPQLQAITERDEPDMKAYNSDLHLASAFSANISSNGRFGNWHEGENTNPPSIHQMPNSDSIRISREGMSVMVSNNKNHEINTILGSVSTKVNALGTWEDGRIALLTEDISKSNKIATLDPATLKSTIMNFLPRGSSIHPEAETLGIYPAQYPNAVLSYVENNKCIYDMYNATNGEVCTNWPQAFISDNARGKASLNKKEGILIDAKGFIISLLSGDVQNIGPLSDPYSVAIDQEGTWAIFGSHTSAQAWNLKTRTPIFNVIQGGEMFHPATISQKVSVGPSSFFPNYCSISYDGSKTLLVGNHRGLSSATIVDAKGNVILNLQHIPDYLTGGAWVDEENIILWSDDKICLFNTKDNRFSASLPTGNISDNLGAISAGYRYPFNSSYCERTQLFATSLNDGSISFYKISAPYIKKLVSVNLDSEGDLAAYTDDFFYLMRGNAFRILHFADLDGYKTYPFEQFDLRLNRPDIVLERLGAPKEAIETAKNLRDKRLKRMGVTEEMLKPDFHLPELQIVGDVPATYSKDQLDFQIKATDEKYPMDRLRVYVNNVPVNGRDGGLLRDQKTQSLEKTIPIKLTAGRNKIQVSVLNSAGAESLYANAEVNCTAERPKPKLYAVALGVSQYDRPEWCLKYAAKDATDLINKLQAKAGSSYSEVKPLLLTDKEVTKDSVAKIKEFLSGATIDDTVLIFMAGHGLLDDKYDYYFGTTDIDPAKPSERGMPYEAIDNILAEVPSLKKALLMDTCHAGELDDDEKKELATSDGKGTLPSGASTAADSAIKGTVAMRAIGTRGMTVKAVEGAKGKSDWYEKLQDMFVDLRRGSGATVISSSQGAEYAFESSEQSNGLFTYALMEALDGKATPNKNGQITISAIGDYVKKRVQDLTKGKQNPNLRGVNLEEDFTLSSTK
jgi:WD40 repeat protein